jgi:hypothetical protein
MVFEEDGGLDQLVICSRAGFVGVRVEIYYLIRLNEID